MSGKSDDKAMPDHRALFSTSYLGPIVYYAQLLRFPAFFIEHFENWQKQSYRNRCTIYGANGKLDLIIPIVHKTSRQQIKDMEISYSYNWQKLHWKSLEAVYRSSPYFEFYEDDFRPFYEEKTKYLIDFNASLLALVCDTIQITVQPEKTTSYERETAPGVIDFRNSIHPKQTVADIAKYPEYNQVFMEKEGFIPNLSIVDLLFNEGPGSFGYLQQL